VGAYPRSASPDLALPDNRGRQFTKGYPSSGGVVYPSHSGNLRPRLIGYSGSRRDANAPVTLPTQEPHSAQIKHRRSVSGAAQMVAGQPENAVASASVSSAVKLLHPQPQTSTRSR
jgi:hypothetical protein